ncbi:MAG: hypothetical protein HQL43_00480 [Alphaproteobacteria bacterium]|nr:hypothetical protein [Alphaproteobacteria bacterium]
MTKPDLKSEFAPAVKWGLTAFGFLHLLLMGQLFLPTVHYYFDAVGIRDAGTLLASLDGAWGNTEKFLYAILHHVEGPAQFLFLNAYYLFVGNSFPLDPSTCQLPNSLIALLSGLVAFLLGRRLVGERFGLTFAALYLLTPWLGAAIRYPWIYISLTNLSELLVLHTFVVIAQDGSTRKNNFFFATSLALFFSTGLSWPSFIPFLFVLLLLTGNLALILRSFWLLLPLGIIGIYAAWTYLLFRNGNPGFSSTILTYPFQKLLVGSGNESLLPDLKFVAVFFFSGLGLLPFFGCAGAYSRTRYIDVRGFLCFYKSPICLMDALNATITIWFCVGSLLVLSRASILMYFYVVGIPVAFLAAQFLYRRSTRTILLILLISLALQWSKVINDRQFVVNAEDLRSLAIATYLIENRPDLLVAEKNALLPRSMGANAGQYARGAHGRLIIQDANNSDLLSSGLKKFDWLIAEPTLLGRPGYDLLLRDPQIKWRVRFRDEENREAWLGEICDGQAAPLELAQVLEVAPLAKQFSERYDRFPHLTRNVWIIPRY